MTIYMKITTTHTYQIKNRHIIEKNEIGIKLKGSA